MYNVIIQMDSASYGLTPVNGKNPCTLFSISFMGISTLVVYLTT